MGIGVGGEDIADPRRGPAGTGSSPALPLNGLPAELWRQLQDRQKRLPVRHIHNHQDWDAIRSNETRVALGLAKRAGLDADQAYSLNSHHLDAITERGIAVRPDLVPPRVHSDDDLQRLLHGPYHRRREPSYPLLPPILHNWAGWVGNRRFDIKLGWFRLRFR